MLDYAFPYQQIWVRFGELFFAGVYANTDLTIELDAAVLKSTKDAAFNSNGVKYLGNDGALNTYLNNHVLFERETQLVISQKMSMMPMMRLRNDKFFKDYDSLHALMVDLDNRFIKQNPSEFSWIIHNERQSEYCGAICAQHWGKEMTSEDFSKVSSHKSYLTSNNGMLFHNYLLNYLIYKPSSRLPISIDNTTVNWTKRTVRVLDSLFSQPKSDYFKIKMSDKDPMENQLVLETILPTIKTEWCYKIVQKENALSLEKIAEINNVLNNSKSLLTDKEIGIPIVETPFGAKLYKIESMDSKVLLSNLKEAFEKKALLIDFWATWCGPCIKEFPSSRQLKDESKELPIEFVYLCTSNGSDETKWKSKIIEYQLSGTHIYLNENIENELMKMFSASGFPSYVLINTKGEYKAGAIDRVSHLNKEKLSALIK